jgi:glycosyltransferase involved in cell wall biosynthesis
MGQRISVVVPAYNEAENLPALVDEIASALATVGEPAEIVIVDDGSTDDTRQVLAALRPRHANLRVLRLRRNAGQSAAFLAGFEAAHGDIVVTLDADLQNNPADIPGMLESLAECDAVLGVRGKRRDPMLRLVSSRVANAVRRAVTGDGLSDVGCSLKAMRREHLSDLPRFNGVHRFLGTLLVWKGCRVREVPVDHRPRRAGVAKYGVRNRAFRTLLDLLAMRWYHSRRVDYEIER